MDLLNINTAFAVAVYTGCGAVGLWSITNAADAVMEIYHIYLKPRR